MVFKGAQKVKWDSSWPMMTLLIEGLPSPFLSEYTLDIGRPSSARLGCLKIDTGRPRYGSYIKDAHRSKSHPKGHLGAEYGHIYGI